MRLLRPFLGLLPLIACGLTSIELQDELPVAAVYRRQKPLRDVVSWDKSSILVNGERIMFLSAEFHPFRLPSPGLWIDVFQKVKSMGFTGVSFYLMWGLLEGEPGTVRINGVYALDEFFKAAKKAGVYLLARPGPYINSEVSGGGFPGWLQRLQGQLRSSNKGYIDAIQPYVSHIARIISDAEITKGGPVIMVQIENEFSLCGGDATGGSCGDKGYMDWLARAFRLAGITVPLINNDAVPAGNFAPGTGEGEIDIYGYDYYPFGWGGQDCQYPSLSTFAQQILTKLGSKPSNWTRGSFPLSTYVDIVPSLPYTTSPRSVIEFQGGAPDSW